MLADTVLRQVGVEDRSQEMELAWLASDELYVKALIRGLGMIHPTLSAPYAGVVVGLKNSLLERGAVALTEFVPSWPQEAPHLPADPGTLDERLYSFLNFYLSSAEDALCEGVIPALIQFAELFSEFSELDSEQALLGRIEPAVIDSPRKLSRTPRYYIVPRYADLGDIAADILGSRDRWPEIVQTYKLEPPFFSDTPQFGKLTPGTRLPVPSGEQSAAPGLGHTFALQTRPGPRGFGQAWDLVDQEGTGLAFDSGLGALGTDLALRLATPLGTLEYEGDYGVYPLAGTPGSVSGMLTGILHTDALLNDPRVEKVVSRGEAQLASAVGVLLQDIVAVPRPELLEE